MASSNNEKKTRRRTGCWTCKRRGYRCDEAKPSCETCKRLGIDCEGYAVRLKWTEGTKLPPQKKPTTKVTPPAATPPKTPEPMNFSQTVSGYPTKASKEIFLLQHFYYTISSLLSSTNDRSINTYTCIVVPMAFSSDCLLNTLLSLSATHLSSRYEEFAISASHYKGLALQSLISHVGSSQEFDEVMLATVIMLSIHEVFDNSPENWAKHLGGAASMFSNFVSKSATTKIASSTRMILDIFAYHDVLASIARRRPPLLPGYYKSAWSAFSGRKTAFLASVETILSLIAQLSTIISRSDADGHSSLDQSPYHGDAILLGQQLQAWSAPEGTPSDMLNTAEAMRQAAILYLNTSLGCGRGSQIVQENVTTILKFLDYVPVESASVASHVWPLYIAGSFVANPQEKVYVRDRLIFMKKLRGIRSIDRVQGKLEQIWEGNSDGVEDAVILL